MHRKRFHFKIETSSYSNYYFRYLDAARLLTKLAEGEVNKHSDMQCIKKLYVLAGLLIEDHLRVQASLTGGTRANIVNNLLPEDSVLLDQIWHAAKGYHFMLLAQRQLRTGLIHSAVFTAMQLRDYEDVLNVEDIYCLLALASCADRSFGISSKAFIKLESLETIPEQRRIEYEELAVSIFSQHEPEDMRTDRAECYICDALIPSWLVLLFYFSIHSYFSLRSSLFASNLFILN